MAEMTTSAARDDFDALLDRVADDREGVLLRRQERAVAAVVSVEDYDLLQRVKAAGQEWLGSERWQQMEVEADDAIVAGRVEHFDDMDSFFAGLDRAVARCVDYGLVRADMLRRDNDEYHR